CRTELLTTKTGTSNGCLPPQPLVRSKVLRPNTKAPVVLRVSSRYSAVCGETMKTMSLPGSLYSVSPAPYHARSLSPPTPMGASGVSFGPAINPSSETESPVRTFPKSVLLPHADRTQAVPAGKMAPWWTSVTSPDVYGKGTLSADRKGWMIACTR